MLMHRKFDPSIMEGKRVLDIGCGRQKLSGSIGADYHPHPGVDVVCDLNRELPFGDSTVDVVFANQVLEHIVHLEGLVYEVHRILRPGGQFVAHTPYFRSAWAHIDPTHVRSFTLSTLDYFVRGTYCYDYYRFAEAAFSAKDVYLDTDYRWGPLRALFSTLAIRRPFRFENSVLSFAYPFEQLTYVLTK